MKTTLIRICELQRHYSSSNTPEMQERGQLIRQTLPSEFRLLDARLRDALEKYSDDLEIGASDGIGRKTEAPWVRICSKVMSPSPTDGYYSVVHFARNGSAVFLTIGCGSTVWSQNGDLVAISDEALTKKTDWARQVLIEEFGTLQPFTDVIHLGAKASLPRTFEKATIVAKRLPIDELDEAQLADYLVQSVAWLRVIYDAQAAGRDVRQPDADALVLQGLSSPTKALRRGQGIRISAEDRKLIEMRAMDLAREWLEDNGYSVKDTSQTASYDFEATLNGHKIKIEVKGTTSDAADAIFMTRNEVDLHRAEFGQTGLILVSSIRLDSSKGPKAAAGGIVHVEIGWDIEQWDLEPMAYRVTRRARIP
ncbi:MAG: MrcB family domain-containing protein [Aquidulcibacter sp.]